MKKLDTLKVDHKFENEKKIEKNKSLNNNSIKIAKQNDLHIGEENGIYCIALHPERNQATVGLGSGIFHIYDIDNWTRIRKLREDFLVSLPLLAIKYYPCRARDTLYTGGSNGIIKTWNLENYNVIQSVAEAGNQITSLDFTCDGSNFVSVGKDRCVRIYDTNRHALSRLYTGTDTMDIDCVDNDFSMPGHSQKIFAVKYHPDDKNVLISASWDHTLKVWDTRLDNAVRTIHGPYVCGDGLDINNNSVLTASWKAHNALQLWDCRMESLIKNLSYPTNDRKGEFLYCGRFWDENHVIAGGSGNNDLKIINIHANKVVGCISGNSHPVQAVEVKNKSKTIFCGTSGNLLKSAVIVDQFN